MYGIFVDRNNSVYVADKGNDQITIWLNGSVNAVRTIPGGFVNPYSIFPITNEHIYFSFGSSNGEVNEWISATNLTTTIITTGRICFGLFIDISDTLYCSITRYDKVVKIWLGDNQTTLTNITGQSPNTLDEPRGIFVDINFDLYVADSKKDRIQCFKSGKTSGTIVAGSGSSSYTISLNYPTAIILDADKYLFIVDSKNHRIVGSDRNGFRCLVGCSGSSGSSSGSDDLNRPWSLSFDSAGNIFVTDQNNKRIQKFILLTNSCSKYQRNFIQIFIFE